MRGQAQHAWAQTQAPVESLYDPAVHDEHDIVPGVKKWGSDGLKSWIICTTIESKSITFVAKNPVQVVFHGQRIHYTHIKTYTRF